MRKRVEGTNHKSILSNLTPTQIQIADLIKQGQTTKEIASLLNLSPSTVACHRLDIRKRLSLTNQKTNLQAALTTNS
jgi:DNA-binding NarL/FixJ family response regulator